ncbi:MAG: hypothetical protein AB1756_02615 [Acidobacteriota bacterium]
MKRNHHNIAVFTILICYSLVSLFPFPLAAEEINVRVELLYPEGMKELDMEQTVSINVCFDLSRSEKNYSASFKYQIALSCNGKKIGREKGVYAPPEGIAIKRTTICKTFKYPLKDLIKPGTIMLALKADVEINEAGGVRLKGESGHIEARIKSDYSELTVSGTVVCPSDLPLSLVRVELIGKVPETNLIAPGSTATSFTDGKGSFSTKLSTPTALGGQVIARLFCPGVEIPSLTVSGNIAENECSFGSIIMQCNRCGGPLTAGEEEQILPPRSPASITSPYEFIHR